MTLRRPALLAGVLSILIPLAGNAQQQPPPAFAVATGLVRVPVVVTRADGSPVRDLELGDFELLEDGRPRRIELLRRAGAGEPGLELLLLLDRSASMLKNLAAARTTAAAFLEEIPKGEARGVIGLEQEARFWREPPADPLALLDQEAAGSAADLGVAVARGVDALPPSGTRKVLVLFSDGEGLAGTKSWNETFQRIGASDVTIYVVSYAAHLGRSSRVAKAQSRLQDLAVATGGLIVDGYPGGVAAVRSVSADLEAQYILGFQPGEQGATGSRKLRVRVRRPGLLVRHRDRFFARPTNESG